ncbi:hypothetical protein MMC24_003212 [Lignoscripta atroalba]|nr:hypothetical protein [Lignoscripta atroalba]
MSTSGSAGASSPVPGTETHDWAVDANLLPRYNPGALEALEAMELDDRKRLCMIATKGNLNTNFYVIAEFMYLRLPHLRGLATPEDFETYYGKQVAENTAANQYAMASFSEATEPGTTALRVFNAMDTRLISMPPDAQVRRQQPPLAPQNVAQRRDAVLRRNGLPTGGLPDGGLPHLGRTSAPLTNGVHQIDGPPPNGT